MYRIFAGAFENYNQALAFAERGRSPYKHGVPHGSGRRLRLRDVDGRPVISFYMHNVHLCDLSHDNMLTFVATPSKIYSIGNSLSCIMHRMLPVLFVNFDKGRYRVCGVNLPVREGTYWANYKIIRKEGQEYFEHLRLNIKTGEIVNAKDMQPEVDAERRKEWIRCVREFRFWLRTMAKLNAFDNIEHGNRCWMTEETVHALADAIMTKDHSPAVTQMMVDITPRWAYRNGTKSEIVLKVFESALTNNSRELRLRAGVLKLKD